MTAVQPENTILNRTLTSIAALTLGLVGLLMSLCGGGFSLMSLGYPDAAGVLVIAVPSLLLGIGFILASVRILNRKRGEPNE